MTYCLNTMLARARIELKLPGEPPLVATSRAGVVFSMLSGLCISGASILLFFVLRRGGPVASTGEGWRRRRLLLGAALLGVVGRGVGRSKQIASQAAAREAMRLVEQGELTAS